MINRNTHRKYETNNKRVPSVTEILSVVAKPYLIPWANKMGLEGIDINERNTAITSIGSLVHAKIEAYYVHKECSLDGFSDEVKNKADELFLKFLAWNSLHRVIPYYIELPIVSEEFGGTIDAIASIDGKTTIIDWKTSRDIYSEYFAQLSAYYYLTCKGNIADSDPELSEALNNSLRQISKQIEQVGIVHIPKENEDIRMEFISVKSEEFKKYWEYFTSCLRLYKAKSKL